MRRASRALISVSDKTGVVEFARALAGYGIELVSTGGTRKALGDAGLTVLDVGDLTGFPEMMDGRVKTLHPAVHGGLLAIRGNPAHAEAMRAHGIRPIDILVVNLYPFEETVARGGDFADCIENIDIGGPAMIRAAAKNHDDVAVVVEPSDYAAVLEELAGHDGMTTLALRRRLAAKAYARTAAYDAAIANWFAEQLGDIAPGLSRLRRPADRDAALRREPAPGGGVLSRARLRFGVATARQAQGKQLSYNNINDTDAAYECVAEFDPARTAACAIIKHANPCGVAEGESLVDAYRKALACDPVSAFGGIVALNRTLDAEAARAITEIFTEVIIAPDATEEAIAIVGAKKNLRLLLAGGLPDPRAAGLTAKTVAGGLLVQSRDNAVVDDMELKPVTKRAPSNAELRDLRFAFRVAKHVKSNTIVYAKDFATVGIGAGQMSRVDCRAHRRAQGRGRRQGGRPQGAGDQRLGGRLRRVLPVRRRLAGRHRGRRHRGDPARRLGARRRGDQGRRRPRHRHGVHRHAAFPALGLQLNFFAVTRHTRSRLPALSDNREIGSVIIVISPVTGWIGRLLMKSLVFAMGAIALGLAAATPARADFAVDQVQGHWRLPRLVRSHGQALGRHASAVGHDAVLGRRPEQRRLCDEAPLVQGLVLLSQTLSLAFRSPPVGYPAGGIS